MARTYIRINQIEQDELRRFILEALFGTFPSEEQLLDLRVRLWGSPLEIHTGDLRDFVHRVVGETLDKAEMLSLVEELLCESERLVGGKNRAKLLRMKQLLDKSEEPTS